MTPYTRDHYTPERRTTPPDEPGAVFVTVLALLAIALLLSALLWSAPASAATNFSASVTNANGTLDTVLTWESDQNECEAAGHPEWSGPVDPSGTRVMPTLSLSGTYTLTLTCWTPSDLLATLSWTNPTENTDGTPYTNPAGTRIVYGFSPDAMNEVSELADPLAETHSFEIATPGHYYFAARSFSTTGQESTTSNIVDKILTLEASEEEFVALTVNPVPRAPTDLTIQ